MTTKVPGKYADISLIGRVGLVFQVLKLPLLLTTTLITSPFVWHNKHKTWRRVLSDRTFRWATNLSIPQIQSFFGSTLETYRKTVPKLNLSPEEEEIGEGARLLWIGPKRTDRVLLYLHGGGFLAPILDAAIYFWWYVKQQLKDQTDGFDLGIVILNYTLMPEDGFPTPLRQTVAAINHLMAQGLQPENLHLAGDSAGGNLVFQTLLHTVRPIESVAPLKLPKPIRGAYMISPWVSLTGDTGSHHQYSSSDIITAQTLKNMGSLVLADVPESQRGYLEAVKAPEDWFEGIDKVVDRILITAGGQECLKEDILEFHDKLKKKYHGDLKLVVQKGGVHNDIFMDFLLQESKLGELTPIIIQWLAAGYDRQIS